MSDSNGRNDFDRVEHVLARLEETDADNVRADLDKFEVQVQQRVRSIRVEQEARLRLNSAGLTNRFSLPTIATTLQDDLDKPRMANIDAVEGMNPSGGNVLMAALRKTGKTVLAMNLAKSLVDGVPFLGRDVRQIQENLIYFNYELTEEMFIDWMRGLNIKNTHKIKVLHLRGHSLPIWEPAEEDRLVEWLIEAGGEVAIIDPAGKASVGFIKSHNERTQVDEFTAILDNIKRRASLHELYMTIHMGWTSGAEDEERTLGSEAWEAWADVIWAFTTDQDDKKTRFLLPRGRVPEQPTFAVKFDSKTRELDDANLTRGEHKQNKQVNAVVLAVGRLCKALGRQPNAKELFNGIENLQSKQRQGAINLAESKKLIRRIPDGGKVVTELTPAGETWLARLT